MKRIGCLFLSCALVLSFGGCSQTDFANIDGVMSPPKLTEEQNMIYAALEDSVGKNIRLKYPKTGDYKSAFVMQNIDDEPGEEAIVFYESTSKGPDASLNVHVKVLDKQDGEWKAAGEVTGDGTEVDKICFGQSKEYGKTYIAIGYSLVNQTEKILKVYLYENRSLNLVYSQGYSVMEVMDLDMDSDDELVVISSGGAKTDPTARLTNPEAKLLDYTAGGFQVSGTVKMDVSVYEYANVQKGKVYPRKTALYLDGLKGTDLYGTEMLYVENGALCNAVYNSRENMTLQTIRVGLKSMDVNNDGILEIPVSYPAPGYEEAAEGDQLLLTDWSDLMDGQLMKIMTAYVNGSEGYIFKFPEEWVDKVSVKKDGTSGDVVFFRYNGSLKNDQTVFLKLRSSKRSDIQQQGVPEGFREVKDYGQMTYLANIPGGTGDDLAVDLKEVEANLMPMT